MSILYFYDFLKMSNSYIRVEKIGKGRGNSYWKVKRCPDERPHKHTDWERHLWSSKYFSWASVCLCVPFFRRSLYFFIKSFLLLFINFVLIENSYNKQYCVWQVSDLLVCYRNVDFGDILTPEVKEKYTNTTYDLVANIVHDGEPGKGTYRVHVLHKVS